MCQRFHHDHLIKLLDHVINERNQTEALLLFPYYRVSYYGNLIIESVYRPWQFENNNFESAMLSPIQNAFQKIQYQVCC